MPKTKRPLLAASTASRHKNSIDRHCLDKHSSLLSLIGSPIVLISGIMQAMISPPQAILPAKPLYSYFGTGIRNPLLPLSATILGSQITAILKKPEGAL